MKFKILPNSDLVRADKLERLIELGFGVEQGKLSLARWFIVKDHEIYIDFTTFNQLLLFLEEYNAIVGYDKEPIIIIDYWEE